MPREDTEFGPFDAGELSARRAYELYADGKVSQALVEINNAIQTNPANSAWHFNKALALDSMSQFEEAITEYEIALQYCPYDLEILNSLGVDYTRTCQYDRALETFEHIQQLDPDFEPCYCNRIITYTEMEQHDRAEEMFYLAQQIEPDCRLCFYNIGNSLFAQGRFAEAIRCWKKTAQIEPEHPQINYRLAQAYWSLGQAEPARQHFLAELRNDPGNVDVLLDFGLYLLEAEDLDSAREKFHRIIELEPSSSPALFYLGEIALRLGQDHKATEIYEQAIENDAEPVPLAGPHYRLAQYALAQQDAQKAKMHLLADLKAAPEDSDLLVSIASMFLQIAEHNYAVHCLLRAVNVDSANADAYYYLGLTSAEKGAYGDACDFFANALDINPGHVAALRDSAVVYFAQCRFQKAARRIERARRLEPHNKRIKWLHRKMRATCILEAAVEFIS